MGDEITEENNNKILSVDELRRGILGEDSVFAGPFGKRKVVYCDLIASGRSVAFIEDFIRQKVLPFYGSTHTTTSVNSRHTTALRKQARKIIKKCVHGSDSDVVIFVGSGATAASHKIIHAIKPKIASSDRTVVFVGPMEHHSSILPWRELPGVTVEMVPEDNFGRVDVRFLEGRLAKLKSNSNLLIGVFSAASNVSGTINDDVAITKILRKYGALAFWDYATAAPYVDINMNPEKGAKKHAVYFSMHKFLGGVQGPGVLVAKKSIFTNPVPHNVGGGTVAFVTRKGHRYLGDIVEREEGGTPAIVESIRAGLTFQLKATITPEFIMDREEKMWSKARKRLDNCQTIMIIGNESLPKLPILSFLIFNPLSGLFLHHNYVCTVLNDVFGIQSRGGCMCAGPYGQALLGIDDELAHLYEGGWARDQNVFEIMKPGFVRLSLPWYMRDSDIDYILDCLELTAKRAWLLLPQYRLNVEDGRWLHLSELESSEPGSESLNKSLLPDLIRGSNHMNSGGGSKSEVPKHDQVLKRCNEIFADCWEGSLNNGNIVVEEEDERIFESSLRWFLLPSEAAHFLATGEMEPRGPPFWPKSYPVLPPSMKQQTVGSHFGDLKTKPISKSISNNSTPVIQHHHREMAQYSPPRNSSRSNNNSSNNSVDGDNDQNWRLYASPTPKFSSGDYEEDQEQVGGGSNHNHHPHHVNMNLQRRMKNVFGRFVARDAATTSGFKH